MSKESEEKRKSKEVTWKSPRDPHLGDNIENMKKGREKRDV